MSDLESFIPSEQSEGFDSTAFEQLKERVKAGAAANAKAQKQEGALRKKENKLIEILLRLIKDNKRKSQLFLIAKLLEENLPPLFVLSIAVLGKEEYLRSAGVEVQKLEPPDDASALDLRLALGDAFKNETLPLELKAKIDIWIKGIFSSALNDAVNVFEKGTTEKGAIKQLIVDCAANIMSDYFEDAGNMPNLSYENYYSFCALIIKNVFEKIKKQIKDQKQLPTSAESVSTID